MAPRTVYTTEATPPLTRNARRPIYVLTSPRTFSAGEGLAFILQERKRAVVIGEVTAGAANPGRSYPAGTMFEITVPNGRVVTAITKRNWEGSGVTPDIIVPAADAFRVAHLRGDRRCDRRDSGPDPSQRVAGHSSGSGETLRKSGSFQRCNVPVTDLPSFLRRNIQEAR